MVGFLKREARVADTKRAQEIKTVDSRLMAVAPAKLKAITPDRLNGQSPHILRKRFGLESPPPGIFIDTPRAGALKTKIKRLHQAAVTVLP